MRIQRRRVAAIHRTTERSVTPMKTTRKLRVRGKMYALVRTQNNQSGGKISIHRYYQSIRRVINKQPC